MPAFRTEPSGGRAVAEERPDAMQRELDEDRRPPPAKPPWYRQIPVVVPLVFSMTALFLSLATTYVGEQRIARQEEHDARVELRGLIQRLSALPKENLELSARFRDDAEGLGLLTDAIGTENVLLAQQAASLIESDLGGDVSAAEYYAVAKALSSSGLLSDSERLLRDGLAVADDRTSELALLRQYGAHLLAVGSVEEGRDVFRDALRIFDKYPERHELSIAATNAQTEATWASAELARGDCIETSRHVLAAQKLASALDAQVASPVDTLARLVAEKCG